MSGQWVYHERQVGSLCGLHCLNNLLQGPRFGPGDLAAIGARLDRKEKKLMGGAFPDGVAASENYDDSAEGGNFSIQVLRVALARAGFKLLPAEHPDIADRMCDPARAAGAFVVQRSNHWAALRATGRCWWDLDSLLERPRPLADGDLAARLGKHAAKGHKVFLVLGGELPSPHPPIRGSCVGGVGRSQSEPAVSDCAGGLGADGGPDDGSPWHDARALLPTSSGRSPAGSPAPPPVADGKDDPGLDGFSADEVRAALALAADCPHLAGALLRRARIALGELLAAEPARLAEALSATVEAVLTARRSLPDCLAQLVVLLCAPDRERLVAAAGHVDCGALAHRLLEALARKARGWLWTEGLELAATVAMDLLLALQPRTAVADAQVGSADATCRQPPRLAESARSDAPSGAGTCEDTGSRSPRSKLDLDEAFEALDELLAIAAGDEGRTPLGGARPLVSAPGLKASLFCGATDAPPSAGKPSRRGGGSGTAAAVGVGGKADGRSHKKRGGRSSSRSRRQGVVASVK